MRSYYEIQWFDQRTARDARLQIAADYELDGGQAPEDDDRDLRGIELAKGKQLQKHRGRPILIDSVVCQKSISAIVQIL